MRILLARQAIVLIFGIVALSSCMSSSTKAAVLESDSGYVDLFTQQEPYSGKGPNVASDAFGPDETVILYAYVAFEGFPQQGSLVAFDVRNPIDESIGFVASTNSSGIAMVSFSIPPNGVGEDVVLGTWLALVATSVGGEILQDSLTFDVGWLVRIASIRTVDQNLAYRSSFGIKGDVGVELTLVNIAMNIRNAAITILMKDELNVPVGHFEINDFQVQPNCRPVLLYCTLHIANWASAGDATVSANALTRRVADGGVPYCPQVSTSLFISAYGPLTIAFHDLAVAHLLCFPDSVEIGQPFRASVVVRNEGTQAESLNLSLALETLVIGTSTVESLPPYSSATIEFDVGTSLYSPSNYTLIASILSGDDEADPADNVLSCPIEIRPKSPSVVHDIAIVSILARNTSLIAGEVLYLNVTVANVGTEPETFNLTTYCGALTTGVVTLDRLAPKTQIVVPFSWTTKSVDVGFYQMSASAPLQDDSNIHDNELVGGVVQIKANGSYQIIHDIALIRMTLPDSPFPVGETATIEIVAENRGHFVESFDVTILYDSTIIEEIRVLNLPSGHNRTLRVYWRTHGFPEGTYTLSAAAEVVPREANVENNQIIGGSVDLIKVKASQGDAYEPMYLLSIFLSAVFVAIVCSRRKRKRGAEDSFSSGWAAWYYARDLRGKPYKRKPSNRSR